jgi:hypothetical protein
VINEINEINDINNYSGKTYDYLCNDGNYAECKNFVKYMDEGESMNWKTPTAREISFPFSDKYIVTFEAANFNKNEF